MDLGLKNYNSFKGAKYGSSAISNPNLSFKGKALIYSEKELQKIAKNVDNILGSDKFFSSKLDLAGISPKDGKFIIKDEGLFEGIFKTIKYPFVDMPLDLANWALKGLKKTPLKDFSEKALNSSLLKKRALSQEQNKSYKLVQDLLGQYFPNGDNIEKGTDNFKNKVTQGITKTVKNYESRDERTLNRMATSTVSAVYSGLDFYNISMLQKDDKEEAKKAEKSRFKQEMTRMAFSAGLTFVTLGALDKYVKSNIVANSLVIALSALISEVGSRILSHTPLHPLSSDEAKKIAEKRNISNNETENNNNKTLNPNFKGNEKELYSKFINQNSTPVSLNPADEKEETKPKETTNEPKKSSALAKALLLFGASSAVYLLSKGVKGEYSAKLARKKLYSLNQEKINDFISDKTSDIGEDILNSIKEISSKQNKTADKFNFFDKVKTLITTKNQEIDLSKLKLDLNNLKQTKEGQEISELLDRYINHVDSVISLKGDKITAPMDRFLIPGVYNGVTKIFKTIYQILSMPGAMVNGLLNKTVFNNSEKALSSVSKKAEIGKIEKLNKGYKKEAVELTRLLNKFNKSDNKNEKIVDHIKRATRNFETGAETGELANLSRTMVTAISTYFFVNDYTNKVLIESKGKDVEKAKEERNERIAHKLSNFVINGTLMNLFNSVFKTPLNSSLLNATMIAAATETTNEFLVRKSICQPVGRKNSSKEIVEYEEQQLNKKGPMGAWSRLFRKITGKKTLTQKAGVSSQDKTKK